MRLGQTSAVQFGSKILVSAIGFFATLYFARVVGAGTLGTYFLLLSAMAWLSILIEAGISESISKRMSEGMRPGSYFALGSAVVILIFGLLTIGIFGFGESLQRYIQSPAAPVYLVALVGGGMAMTLINAGLTGSHNVHVSGVLTTVQSILRVTIQVGAVSIGMGLLGLIVGWVAAAVIVAGIGIVYLTRSIDIPLRHDVDELRTQFQELLSYAKFSWLGSIKAKTNNYADMLILGLFVPNGLIGVYAVSWNIASFLTIFGAAMQQTLFPEISRLSAGDDHDETAQLIAYSMQYTGLFVIPGFFGGVVLGPRILRLYGSDFIVGTTVLYLLIVAVLLFDYQKQLTNALNGMDHPNLAFRVNAVFVTSNIVLNVGLIAWLGWVGAALATMISSGLGLVYSFSLTSRFADLTVPLNEIGKQVFASIIMSAVVISLLWAENTYGVINSNFIVVVGLVVIGAAVYLGILLVLSSDTRETIFRNLGIEYPVF